MAASLICVFVLATLTATVAAQLCPCPRHYNPMCGSDGVTYGNECTFRCARSSKPDLALKHQGRCRPKRSDEKDLCPCTRELRALCGTDGVTYWNPCLLRCAAKSNPGLVEAYSGPCTEEKENEQPCICTMEYRPVCGSDGETYGNACALRCEQGSNPNLSLKYVGECEDGSSREKRAIEKTEQCPCTRELRLLCGTDGVTYGNPCLLKCAAKSNPELKTAYSGPCSAKKDYQPRSCACPKINRPVCGSDGVTYGNECDLRCEQDSKADLVLKYVGECVDENVFCFCTREQRFVCGTNGETYGNPCELRCAARTTPGLRTAHMGRCYGSTE